MGREIATGFQVAAASGPGTNYSSSEGEFQPDDVFLNAYLRESEAIGRGVYLGQWHKHPNDGLNQQPSGPDIETMRNVLERQQSLLSVLVCISIQDGDRVDLFTYVLEKGARECLPVSVCHIGPEGADGAVSVSERPLRAVEIGIERKRRSVAGRVGRVTFTIAPRGTETRITMRVAGSVEPDEALVRACIALASGLNRTRDEHERGPADRGAPGPWYSQDGVEEVLRDIAHQCEEFARMNPGYTTKLVADAAALHVLVHDAADREVLRATLGPGYPRAAPLIVTTDGTTRTPRVSWGKDPSISALLSAEILE
ncbi:MAG: hypothetical protein ACYDDF_05370 [Thermoplasmatota archaeon]